MPTFHLERLEGRSLTQKKKPVQETPRVTVEVLGGLADAVDSLTTDVKRGNWATGARLWPEPRP